MYRAEVTAPNYFTAPPNVILSLLGYKQMAPSTANTFVGFDANISAIRTTAFDIVHNFYGASMIYLNYMYLALAISNTDFVLGYYVHAFDTTAVNKSYSFDIAYKTG